MKQRSLLVFCIILAVAGFAAGQSKSLTNADLEKYRQERLKAEQEYRETYARLGRPSPEELDRQRDKSLKETLELSESLRAARIESERIEAEREANELLAARYFDDRSFVNEPQYLEYPIIWPFAGRHGF